MAPFFFVYTVSKAKQWQGIPFGIMGPSHNAGNCGPWEGWFVVAPLPLLDWFLSKTINNFLLVISDKNATAAFIQPPVFIH